jgi:hypothetical protein
MSHHQLVTRYWILAISTNYGCECNRDLDEVAGAADAIACSYRSYFLRCNSRLLGDNRLAVLPMSFSSIRLLPLLRRSNGETAIEYPLIMI